MDFPKNQSRFCNLDKIQMQYVNTIDFIVADILSLPRKTTKVLDFLYLGTLRDATDLDLLKKEGITHICNAVESNGIQETGQSFYGSNFTYYGFSSEDNESYPINKHFDDVYKFIESVRTSNGKCLVHCMAGINRSGFLVTAYVMLTKNIGPIEAVDIVFKKRGMLLTNTGFIEQLVELAAAKNLLEKDKHKLLNRFTAKK